jgi:hypothetical protein
MPHHIITRRRNPIWVFAGGMESTTGYCPPVWDLLLALVDAQVQGTTVFSFIWQILFVFTTYSQVFVCALAGIEPAHWPFWDCKSSVLTTRPAGQPLQGLASGNVCHTLISAGTLLTLLSLLNFQMRPRNVFYDCKEENEIISLLQIILIW